MLLQNTPKRVKSVILLQQALPIKRILFI